MEMLRDLIRQMRREPVRMLLTLLGIAIGSGAVVLLASTLRAATFALDQASQEATGDDITRVTRRTPGPGAMTRVAPGLSERDMRAMADRERIAHERTIASATVYHQEASVGARAKPVGVQSGGTRYAALSGFELQHGRWMLPEEEGRRVCVIGADVWKELFEGQWPLRDDALVLNHATRLSVIGVLAPRPPIGGGDGDGTWMVDRRVIVSNPTFARAVAPMEEFDEIALKAEPRQGKLPDRTEIAQRLSPLLQNLHLGVKNFEFDALGKGMQVDMLITGALGVILLGCALVATVVGAVNVMNAQLVQIAERTREYGICRALGLSARKLRARVLLETLACTLVGSVVGVASGLGLAWALSKALTLLVTPWPFDVVLWSIGAAVGGAALAGLLAGWMPAKRASEIPLAECLKAE
ncbi:MAG: ABC transporter permease [Deltaproteobacteria bacterium]|nr:ABC transporter permease [Deltaproteobacteria bacterium]